MSEHHRRYFNMEVTSKYVMNNMLLEVTEIKASGVLCDSLLIFDKHICEKKINKAYMMLGIIKRNFTYNSRKCFIILYKSLVRSHLEYANNVWYLKQEAQLSLRDRASQLKSGKILMALEKACNRGMTFKVIQGH